MEKLLMCKKGCCAYSLTTYGVLCKLIRWIDDTEMKVQIVSGSNTGDEYNVMYHLFEEITLDEFKHQFPGESIAYNLINEVEKCNNNDFCSSDNSSTISQNQFHRS